MKAAARTLVLAALVAACSPVAQTSSLPASPAASPQPSLPPPPAAAASLQPSLAAATPTAFVPFTVRSWADNVALRANPGYLFPVLSLLGDGTRLTVLGRAPGGEWLLVETAEGQAGWVFEKLVEGEGTDSDVAPIISPTDTLVVRGHLSAGDGSPISGVQFALVQGTGANAPRTDAMTDDDGVFHAFMPPQTSGTWWVSYTAISCDSNIMDASCNWVGAPVPEGMYVDLPAAANLVLEFGWR